MTHPTPEILSRLSEEKNIWLASVRPDGRPHLVPLWFVWDGEAIYICISSQSVKFRNLTHNLAVTLALEDGTSPLICEGSSFAVPQPWPAKITAAFKHKYDWEIKIDQVYDTLIRIGPKKWLNW